MIENESVSENGWMHTQTKLKFMQSTNKFKWNAGHVDCAIISVAYSYMNELSSVGMIECNAALPRAQRENLIQINAFGVSTSLHSQEN